MKYKITLNERVYEVEVERGEAMLLSEYEMAAPAAAAMSVAPAAQAPAAAAPPAAAPTPGAAITGQGEIIPSPLPGTVLSVNVKQGEAVKSGQILLIIEAMKMETEVMAPRDGIITQVLAAPAQKIDTGDALVVLS